MYTSKCKYEDEERMKREKNIIIRGIPEDDQIDNKEIVEYILRTIECNAEIPKVMYVDRLGAKKSSNAQSEGDRQHHRPIRIKFEDLDAKKKVMKNGPKIRAEQSDQRDEDIAIINMIDSKQIFILPDKTKMEREADVELRKSLESKRKDFPQEKWKIRHGKIVKVVPNPTQ